MQNNSTEDRLIAIQLSTQEKRAMNISLTVGIMMLFLKWFAFWLTGSSAIFSDASETVVHIFAVAFAAYSLRIAYQPPDEDHHFGHDKISYFSAGFEGGLIIVAAIVIIYAAIEKMITGVELEQVGAGVALVAIAGAINAILGWYLLRVGKKTSSMILTANGKHILTDAWTSLGAILGLGLVLLTDITLFDPIIAILFAGNILYEGGKLVRNSVRGLMDKTNPELEEKAILVLQEFCTQEGISFHRLRLRESGASVYIDFHVQFPDETTIQMAHDIATRAEQAVAMAMDKPADVISHLESFSSEGIRPVTETGTA
jgi:cation diffusion facilitator family transporter